MFSSEGLQANTTLVLGGQTNQDGQVLLGTFQNGDYVFGTKLQTSGPVKKLIRTKDDTFYVFEDTVNGSPIQTFSIASPTLTSIATPYSDVSAATYLPYSNTFLVTSSPTQMSYVNATTKVSTLAYDAAKDRDEDEVLVYKGGIGTLTGSEEGGGLLLTEGSIQIGSKRTNNNANMDDYTLIYDIRSRNLGGLLYSGSSANAKYTYRTGSNTNTILTSSNSTNYKVSNIFRYDSPFGADLTALTDFTVYIFVRDDDFETAAPFLSYLYEYRTYADSQLSTSSWTDGPILPENPTAVTISGLTFTSGTSLPQNTLVYDVAAPNTYYFTRNTGSSTTGPVVAAPKYTRSATSFGPNAIGVSMAYHDPVTNFTAFATKSTDDIPDPSTIQSLAVTFSTSALDSFPDYSGSTDVLTPVVLSGDRTKVSIESWNGTRAASAWTPLTVSVPPGASTAYVYMWGAGGGSSTGNGGAAGYVSCSLDVTTLTTLSVIVGSGGDKVANVNPTYFTGGIADGGSGGGRTAIQSNNVDLVTAGGGGGAQGGGYGGPGGQVLATVINGLLDDKSFDGSTCGTSATSLVPGKNATDADQDATTPGQYVAGQSSYFAGGGSGYFGGGCAASSVSGAGGGSSYTASTRVNASSVDANPGTLSGPYTNSLYPEFTPGVGGLNGPGTEGFLLIQFVTSSSSSTPGPSRQLYLASTDAWFTSLATFPFVKATLNGNPLTNPVRCLCYSGSTVVLATDSTYIPYVPGVAYTQNSYVRYQGTNYKAKVDTSNPPTSADWVVSITTSLYYATVEPATTAGVTTFFTGDVDFQPVLIDGSPLQLSGLNAIEAFPQKSPTFILMGSGFQILERSTSGPNLWTYTIGNFPGYEATDFNCIDGGYEAGQNSFTVAAVPKQLSLGFTFQTKYAPTFAGADVTNPYTVVNGTAQAFDKSVLFASNGTITVAVGGPLQNPSTDAGYAFTNYNISWAPSSAGGAYLSYATSLSNDMRYQTGGGAYVPLPLSSTSAYPFMSPANVLVTSTGTSYSMVKDARSPSTYLFTFFNSVLPTTSGKLEATTARFTDVQYVPVTSTTGYFIATGVALWDLGTLVNSTWTTSTVPQNVVWVSNTLTSLSDMTNATLWKPIQVLTNNPTDALTGIKLALVESIPYLLTTHGTYKLESFTSASCTATLVGNSGDFASACTNSQCQVCEAGSFAEVVVTTSTAGQAPTTSVVCLEATSQSVANANATQINGFTTTTTAGTTFSPTTSEVLVELWGAGGSNAKTSGAPNTGGAGGYMSAIVSATQNGTPVNVPPLTIVTGTVGGNTVSGGFGAVGTTSNGGGYSGVFVTINSQLIPLCIAPGGGGGGSGSDFATGGGGGSPSNPVTIDGVVDQSALPDSASPSSDGTQALVDDSVYVPSAQSITGAGAGGGYPVGTPGLAAEGITLGGSGGAFYPLIPFTVTGPNGLTISVDILASEPGNTLAIAYTTTFALPGGSGSPNWISPAGSTNTNGLVRITPQNSATAFTVKVGPDTDIGLSSFPSTLKALLPVNSLQSLVVPVDPSFQSNTSIGVVGTTYVTKFDTMYSPPSSAELIANVLTKASLSNQNLQTLDNRTYGDLVTLDVLSQSNVALQKPAAPSTTGTMPQLNETSVVYTLSTATWDNGTTPTLTNYVDYATSTATADPVEIDPSMKDWLNFGTVYTSASGVPILVHGPGRSLISDVATTVGPLVAYNWPTVNNPYLLSPNQTYTTWDPPSGQLVSPSLTIQPDPILALRFSTETGAPSSSVGRMTSTNFLRPRNWAFTTNFAISGSYVGDYNLTTPLGLSSIEFVTPDPELRALQVSTDSVLNTIVGVGRYPMYASVDNGTTWSSFWPAWTGVGSPFFPTGVTYSVRTEPLSNAPAFFYMQNTTVAASTVQTFQLYFFVEVDTPNYTFTSNGTVSALGPSAQVIPNADGSDSTIVSNGNTFDPMQHLFFIDPNQPFTNCNIAMVNADQCSNAVWNLTSIFKYIIANGGSAAEVTPSVYTSTVAGTTYTKRLFTRNHVVGLGSSMVYDTLAGASTPASYTITAMKAYVCYAYEIQVPSSFTTPGVGLDQSLFTPPESSMNVSAVSINVEPFNGGPQIPNTVFPNHQLANVDLFVDSYPASTIVNPTTSGLTTTNGLTFTRYIKDPFGLSTQYFTSYNTYFPVEVTYPNVHYTPAFTVPTKRFGYTLMTAGDTWTTIDPTFFYVSENLLGTTRNGQNQMLGKASNGLLWSNDYATLTYTSQNVFGGTSPSGPYPGAQINGNYIPYVYKLDETGNPVSVSGFNALLKDSTRVLCVAPAVMTSTTSGFQGRNSFDHDTALSLNQFLPTFDVPSNTITLQNLELASEDLPTLADIRNSSSASVKAVKAATFYVSSPIDFYIANLNPTVDINTQILVDDLYVLSGGNAVYKYAAQSTTLLNALLTANPTSTQFLQGGAGGYTGGGSGTFAPAYYPSGGMTGGDGYGTQGAFGGALPSQYLTSITNTVRGTSYDFDGNQTTCPNVLQVSPSAAKTATNIVWDLTGSCLALGYRRDRLDPNNSGPNQSSDNDQVPPQYLYEVQKLATTTTTSVTLNTLDPSAAVTSIVTTLNNSMLLWNTQLNATFIGSLNPGVVQYIQIFPSRIDGVTSRKIESYFGSTTVNGQSYLTLTCVIGAGRGGDVQSFGWNQSFEFYAYVSVDFRFCDPMTRKLLGMTRSTRLLSASKVSYNNLNGNDPNYVYEYVYIFPDPIDLSVNTKVLHVLGNNVSSPGTYSTTNTDTRSLNVYITSNVDDLPQGLKTSTIRINGSTGALTKVNGVYSGPVNVRPIYNNDSNFEDVFAAAQNLSIPGSSVLTASSKVQTGSSVSFQTVPNFNGFRAYSAGQFYSFVKNQWIFWPFSNARKMTSYNGSSYALIASRNVEPEFTVLATTLFMTSPFTGSSVHPNSFAPLEGTPYALVGTNVGDIRLLNLADGSINLKTVLGAFKKQNVPVGVSNISEVHVLDVDYFVLTNDGLFTTYNAKNDPNDLQTGNLQAISFVPLFDTTGQAGISVSGTKAYLAQLTITKVKKINNILVCAALNGATNYVLFLWMARSKLLYSVATTSQVFGLFIDGPNLLAMTSTGLSYAQAEAYWNTPKIATLSLSASNLFTASATIGLPDFVESGPNDVIEILTTLQEELRTALTTLPYSATVNPMVPLYTQSWDTIITLYLFFNASPPAGFDPPTNVEGVTVLVQFGDVSATTPFVLTGSPAFPASGIFMDPLSQHLLNFRSTRLSFPYATSPTQSLIESTAYDDNSFPNFYRNVFFKVKKSGTATLTKFRSTLRNTMQFFSDQITTAATEVNAGIVISDVDYSPDQNVLVWVPRGTFGSVKTLVATTVDPSVPLLGTASGPIFGSEGLVLYNPFQTSFLVAGKGPSTKVLRLDVSGTPTWSDVYSGDKILGTLLESMTITCLGASPSCECIAGSVNGVTSLWFRIYPNTTWQKAVFEQVGTITAVAFVGFGWYISTWDASIKTETGYGLSSLWFASNNFTVVVYVDAWNAADRTMKINSIGSYNAAQEGVCPTGYEQSTDNPNVCYKICPSAYEGINDLCAMKCPTGYATGVSAQYCYPNRYTPARTHPVRPTVRNAIDVPDTSAFDANVGPPANTSGAIKWGIGIGSAVAIGGALVIGLLK